MNPVDIARMQYDNRSLSSPAAPAASKPAAGAPAAGKASAYGIVAPVRGDVKIDKGSKLYDKAQEFESLFVKMMLTEMKKSVDKAGMIDGGMAEDIFSDMLYDEYAKSMTKSAGFGLADQVYLQLTDYGRIKSE
jgi:peptidoglycan hydrolase FlgJ